MKKKMYTRVYVEYVEGLVSGTKRGDLESLLIKSTEWDGCKSPKVLNAIASIAMADRLKEKPITHKWDLSDILAILTHSHNWEYLSKKNKTVIYAWAVDFSIGHELAYHHGDFHTNVARNRGGWYDGLRQWGSALSPSNLEKANNHEWIKNHRKHVLPMRFFEDMYWTFFLNPKKGQFLSENPHIVEGNRLIRKFEKKKGTATNKELLKIYNKILSEIYPDR